MKCSFCAENPAIQGWDLCSSCDDSLRRQQEQREQEQREYDDAMQAEAEAQAEQEAYELWCDEQAKAEQDRLEAEGRGRTMP